MSKRFQEFMKSTRSRRTVREFTKSKKGHRMASDCRGLKFEYFFKKEFSPLWCTQPTAVERLGTDPI